MSNTLKGYTRRQYDILHPMESRREGVVEKHTGMYVFRTTTELKLWGAYVVTHESWER